MVLYEVSFAPYDTKRRLHGNYRETRLGVVSGVEDSATFSAYNLHGGKHIIPDYAAIRSSLPHYHRKAFDRAPNWGFPITLRASLTETPNPRNAASRQLYDSRGRLLGTLYATPYLSQ